MLSKYRTLTFVYRVEMLQLKFKKMPEDYSNTILRVLIFGFVTVTLRELNGHLFILQLVNVSTPNAS